MGENWRTDTEGLTLQGASGGGKTTTGRGLHIRFPGPSIYFDIDEEPELGTEVNSVAELANALDRGETTIVVRPAEYEVENPDLFPETVRFLVELGNELRGTSAKMQFIVGEAQDVQERWVKVAMKRLRKRRIKPVVETQDPMSLSVRIRTQAAYQAWVSPPKNKQVESLRSTDWPVDLLKQLDQYQMIVFGEGWKPLARITASEAYAVE